MNNSNEKRARRIASLLAGYIRDTLTPAEHDELDEWVGASDKNMRLFEELTDEKRIQLALELLNDDKETGILKELQDDTIAIPARRPASLRINRYAVAASFAAVIVTAAFFLLRNKSQNSPSPGPVAHISLDEIKPSSDRAMLALADHSVIELDKVKDGTIATQGISYITKQNGQVTYNVSEGQAQNIQLPNSISTPRGGKYTIVLPDGTKAWLDALSSISYPAAFAGAERRVAIKGQVYLEVASAKIPGPNYKKPFIVEVTDRNMAVQVLGTHFNVNAYNEDSLVTTVLLEGSIKIASASGTRMMVPGQQAEVKANGEITLAQVDTEKFISWKNGILQPNNEELGSVMRKISRWFDVDVVFEDNSTSIHPVTSTLNLNGSLAATLRQIEQLAHVQCPVEGRKVIVKSL